MTYIPTEEHIAMWNRGAPSSYIAERAGVHRATVCRGFAKIGSAMLGRRNPQTIAAIEEAKRMRASGMTMEATSEKLGYSVRTIQRWLNGRSG